METLKTYGLVFDTQETAVLCDILNSEDFGPVTGAHADKTSLPFFVVCCQKCSDSPDTPEFSQF